ncbi:DUF4974 domain-containing protein [Olivibacter sp. CPCC 100613]|uniref:FecR family protein n=1 Tax=Olivibacter sp. CPCC 100613 TaxID=3079931 RepID=UPI002FFBB739
MPKSERLVKLITAYINEQISEADFNELAELIKEEEEELSDAVDKAWKQADQPRAMPLNAEGVFSKIVNDPRIRPISPKRTGRMLLVAASLTALVCCSLFLLTNKRSQPAVSQTSIPAKQKDSKGVEKKEVLLTLSDGQQIPVNALKEGIQTLRSGDRIKKDHNQLIYTEDTTLTTNRTSLLHTVTTPIGMDYALTLPDGTYVQLNAGSSITYPLTFQTAERRVKLSGEAYFEVSKHANQAFLVQAKGTQIQVLGTSFNVKAYQEEHDVITTLVNGSIKVQSKMLRPGQQALSNAEHQSIVIQDVDTEEVTAWRRGYFSFNNEDIEKVMNTLAKWYEIDVIYQGNLKGKTFGGTLSRYADFHQLLYAIEQTGSVTFTIEGRRVIVSP